MKCKDCNQEKKSTKGLYCKVCGYKHRIRPNKLKYSLHKDNPTWFKKKHSPWNKGTKGLIKPNKGNFKKGHISWMKDRFDEKSSNWRNGSTQLCEKIRKSDKYKLWRKIIYKKFKFKCFYCGSKNKLEAHHIKEFIRIIKENNIKTVEEAIKCKELWQEDNGLLLCGLCHNKTKKGCGKK